MTGLQIIDTVYHAIYRSRWILVEPREVVVGGVFARTLDDHLNDSIPFSPEQGDVRRCSINGGHMFGVPVRCVPDDVLKVVTQ